MPYDNLFTLFALLERFLLLLLLLIASILCTISSLFTNLINESMNTFFINKTHPLNSISFEDFFSIHPHISLSLSFPRHTRELYIIKLISYFIYNYITVLYYLHTRTHALETELRIFACVCLCGAGECVKMGDDNEYSIERQRRRKTAQGARIVSAPIRIPVLIYFIYSQCSWYQTKNKQASNVRNRAHKHTLQTP